jgi:hypothetical protein
MPAGCKNAEAGRMKVGLWMMYLNEVGNCWLVEKQAMLVKAVGLDVNYIGCCIMTASAWVSGLACSWETNWVPSWIYPAS